MARYETIGHRPKGLIMAKILHREVQEAHNAWATAASKWGNDNLSTIRNLGKYYEAKDKYLADYGKAFQPKSKKGRR